MLTRVKEIVVPTSIMCTNDLEKYMEWIAHLNLKAERLNHNLPHSPPERLHSLYHYK